MWLLELGTGKQRSPVMVVRRRYMPVLSWTSVTYSIVYAVHHLNTVETRQRKNRLLRALRHMPQRAQMESTREEGLTFKSLGKFQIC